MEFPLFNVLIAANAPRIYWRGSVHRASKQRKARNMTRIDRFDSLRSPVPRAGEHARYAWGELLRLRRGVGRKGNNLGEMGCRIKQRQKKEGPRVLGVEDIVVPTAICNH